jgi:hypothetical protein
MDYAKAQLLLKELRGKTVGGWTVDSLVNHGKSAAVFRALDPSGSPAALKIFDDELIAQYGDEVQLHRIERELALVGKHHPHMVNIIVT